MASWRDYKFANSLSEAAVNKDPEKVKEALAKGDDIAACDSIEQTALILCVRDRASDEADAAKMAECAKLLIDAGADVNTPDQYGDQPLALACMDGGGVPKEAIVQHLISAGADVLQVTDNFKMTPLHWAAVCGSKNICKILIDNGSRKNKIDRNRDTPIMIAREQLKRIEANLDLFGHEYKGDDKPQQVKKFADLIEYFESVPGLKKD
eukprot:CAMPEP_0119353362 /NCGR_PEP_ID=MMETSP1334-20130426/2524_1 /TAXON_ID=127549 /ORGANISM="Calcidiscus leptoporus, Strain RCC1130" /LENGTH=208 /DNA_ID=CAMNT_0007366625 /DNA_START=50 /DNA_END=676 /DNA_ORIENTATION=-